MTQTTCVLLKPDAVGRGLNFEITEKFEKKSFKLAACRMLTPSREQAEAYYLPLQGKPGYEDAVTLLTSGPAIATAWTAPDAVAAALVLAGDADPTKAALNSIRGELAIDPKCNLIECSADAAAASRELAIWFTPEELGGAPMATANGTAAAEAGSSAGGPSKAELKKQAKEEKKAAKKGGKQTAARSRDPDEYEPPSGTRDFFPEDMRVRNWLFGKFRETARLFAFQEYDAPVLEKEELYKRKAGEEIVQQMYNFVDKDGKAVTLRPEMTPTLARMILSLGDRFLKPVKWFSIPQCWRFETVQRGRKREHFQWNMDIIGEAAISAEVELLAAISTFFLSVGVTSADVGIKVNSRKVLACILAKFGVTSDMFERVCVIVDKLDKIGPEATVELLVPVGVPDEAAKQIVASLSLKSVAELEELVGEHGKEAVLELKTLFEIAEAYGFGDWLYFDASVVRGLAYYTGVVFEGFDRRGELRAICGGGRYDKLLTLYGAEQVVPCCGFGFGDCVIMELLREKGTLPTLEPLIDFVVLAFNAEMRSGQVQVAATLRKAGFTVDVLLEPAKKVTKAFNYADRVNGRRVLFVAPDEWEAGKVRMKDLRTGNEDEKEVNLTVASLIEELHAKGVQPSTEAYAPKAPVAPAPPALAARPPAATPAAAPAPKAEGKSKEKPKEKAKPSEAPHKVPEGCGHPDKEAKEKEKLLKTVIKEGGKKGVEIEGASDMGGLDFFCTTIESPDGDIELLQLAMTAMNAQPKPDDEERKGCSGHVGKMIFSAGVKQLALVAYVPQAESNKSAEKIDVMAWMEHVCKAVGGEIVKPKTDADSPAHHGHVVEAIVKSDPDKGKFALKEKDSAMAAAFAYLREHGAFPEDEEDDDDEPCFGDDAFDNIDEVLAPRGSEVDLWPHGIASCSSSAQWRMFESQPAQL